MTIDKKLKLREVEQKQMMFETAGLPLFQYVSEADTFIRFGCCKLRTLAQLEELREQYQQIYFSPSANTKGKSVVFFQLRKLSYRI